MPWHKALVRRTPDRPSLSPALNPTHSCATGLWGLLRPALEAKHSFNKSQSHDVQWPELARSSGNGVVEEKRQIFAIL
jgi:hypothetical protein